MRLILLSFGLSFVVSTASGVFLFLFFLCYIYLYEKLPGRAKRI